MNTAAPVKVVHVNQSDQATAAPSVVSHVVTVSNGVLGSNSHTSKSILATSTTATVSTAVTATTAISTMASQTVSLSTVAKPSINISLEPTAQARVLTAPMGTLVAKVATPVSQPPRVSGPRMPTPQQTAPLKVSQTAAIPQPANFQIPPGTILIRSNSGQLMLVSQQALARAQAQMQGTTSPRLPVSTNTPPVRICTVQSAAVTCSVVPRSTATPSTALSSSTVKPSMLVTSEKAVIPSTLAAPARAVTPSTLAVPTRAATPAIIVTPSTLAAPTTASMPATVMTPSTLVAPTRAATPAIIVTPSTLAAPVRTATPVTLVAPVRTATPATIAAPARAVLPTVRTPSTLAAPTKTVTPVTLGAPIRSSIPSAIVTSSTPAAPARAITTATVVTPSTLAAPARTATPATPVAQGSALLPKVISVKAEEPTVTRRVQASSSTEMLDNVKKCKNFLATLIKLACSGPQSPEMGQNVKNLVQNLLEGKLEPEEFTKKLYTELKSSPQPYLVPFLKKSLPALRQLMPNSLSFIQQCVQQQPQTQGVGSSSVSVTTPKPSLQLAKQASGTSPVTLKLQQPHSVLIRSTSTPQAVKVQQLVVQKPAGAVRNTVTVLPQTSAVTANKPEESRMPLNTVLQANQFPPASILKQITVPGNKILSLRVSTAEKNKIQVNGTASFRDEDDINDVTSMAGVNLSEERACILATNCELVGTIIRSSVDEPFLFKGALQKKILDIGKKHNVMELSSEAVNLISHATQERLRELIEKLAMIARHRTATYKESEKYMKSSDTRSQLRFLEQLDQLEKRRKNEEEREMLLRAAKSRSNKEDPEQQRLKQKAKEMQQMELAQIQHRDANLTALAAIGPRRKRPLDSSSALSGCEHLF
ncbi:transcription initiation factor TFIID subunit 4B isoform X2 [Rhinatrema bivittatum]|uniref:transcription initiation factor TFIID subunit 4B isoform X2 n=1 Tax=Rhinatrema bivittatum TaxID=194408 RepID=UPI0011274798|nr:transcription initiation factor TFIID subunit 4B isoform X2 [Rhinatrema bivittatum]